MHVLKKSVWIGRPSLTLPCTRLGTVFLLVAFLAASVASDVFHIGTRKSSIGGNAGKPAQVDLFFVALVNQASCFPILSLLTGFSTYYGLVRSLIPRFCDQGSYSSGIVAVEFLVCVIFGRVGRRVGGTERRFLPLLLQISGMDEISSRITHL